MKKVTSLFSVPLLDFQESELFMRRAFDSLFHSNSDPVLFFDPDDRLFCWNSNATRIFSDSKPPLEQGISLGALFGQMTKSPPSFGTFATPILLGSRSPSLFSLHRECFRDGNRLLGSQLTLHQQKLTSWPQRSWLSEFPRRLLLRIARREAARDHLTQLPDRAVLTLYDEIIRATTSSQDSRELGKILFCDLSHFKQINDRFGHLEGDRILKKVGQQLQCTFSFPNLVVRYGGDEFVIVCPGAVKFSMEQKLKIVCEKTQPSLKWAQAVQFHIGIAPIVRNCSLKETLTKADRALIQNRTRSR